MSKISQLKTKTPMQKFFKKLLQYFNKEDYADFGNRYGSYSISAYSTDYEDIRIFFYYYPVGSWKKDIDFGDFLKKEKANKEEKVMVEIINDNDRNKDKLIEISDSQYKINGFEKYKKEIEDYLIKEQKCKK